MSDSTRTAPVWDFYGQLSRKAKLWIYWSIFVPTLTYGHKIWVVTERARLRIQAAEIGFLRLIGWGALPSRGNERKHLVRMPIGRLPLEVFRARPTGREPGQTQDSLEGLCVPSGLGTHQDPPVSVAGERDVFSPGPVASGTQLRISGWKLMDGWS